MAGGALDTVVFDIGNVLIDWNPRYLYRKMFDTEKEMETFVSDVDVMGWHLEQDRGRSLEEGTEALISRHPEYAAEIEAFYGRWEEMFGGEIEGAVRVLGELRALGYPLYALTNYSSETFPLAREQYGFLRWFDEIVVSGEEGFVKPDREIYDLLVERTGLDPARSAFVDDKEENVRTAEGLGFTGVVFRDGAELREEMIRLGLLSSDAAGETGEANG
ncbi:HAD family hydrolase [Rubrobacter aplysinae]|uniref:HAD family hydrolase n=1 Tax=Rubrobacter aplysinae TaxID=909625 RepID=UPI000AD0DB6D|nr:HAD family phosphatase [Rubrobacter aplysinae]